MPPRKSAAKSKGKGKTKVVEPKPVPQEQVEDISMEVAENEPEPEPMGSTREPVEVKSTAQAVIEEVKEMAQAAAEEVVDVAQAVVEKAKDAAQSTIDGAKDVATAATEFADTMNDEEPQGLTLEERMEKMKQLRLRMRQSAKDNRVDLITETQKTKSGAREAARQDKQRKLQELLRLKAEADDRGEDLERSKNWEYTIEENDAWEKKLKRKKTRADFEFHDDAHAARRKYKKDLDLIKPNLEAYNAQKETALGYAPGTLTSGASSSSAVVLNQAGPVTTQQQLAAENLYRDANSLLYADNKPTEDAIDRVVSKLNLDLDKRSKRSRKRANEDEGDITYINERNRVFNKKIARYYDKYTTEIRASFERGTAL